MCEKAPEGRGFFSMFSFLDANFPLRIGIPMTLPCRYRLWIIAILAAAVGLSAIPVYAESMFGPVPSFSDIIPSGEEMKVPTSGTSGTDGGSSLFGPTFSTSYPGVFGPVPDITPRASRGDSASSNGSSGILGDAPSVTDGGFGPTFSTTSPGIFGPVPDVVPRASQAQ
ncbi:hypothetical protein A2454_04825 [Candidatus Peribacteria bacterium RIFOXYC2_FULL_55_14]|nr:MAG: hypothetical protein A2198_06020 [Candidatus Peribacteria bacterium RIFOXYA1_FULL_56_14]OGJ74326.1 MAG: hypothetical protein A2384_06385 [Candidatus Peribacteria bacterium RIFOXYB1_FULL_54_35]OGJ75139.1 MAG: hypothetical protein A2217_05415 [Candidatus Peribacteria bacterium RIFOXYA2_FULL_55_28]OGJ75944.1 MAG: hypothetical protein A2327_03530 [Candidatus Peribacteria bacterium RIFOXYB2_FULL_54_17]OGJ77434.1 MAG: hypothetical protein A2424_03725 [Candidatus Peribacteria bacterium RIFOXYC